MAYLCNGRHNGSNAGEVADLAEVAAETRKYHHIDKKHGWLYSSNEKQLYSNT